jgi:hypothetical protein
MSKANSKSMQPPPRLPITLERFDLNTHPDSLLLRLCACLCRMRDAVAALEAVIVRTPPLTPDGARMKELTL